MIVFLPRTEKIKAYCAITNPYFCQLHHKSTAGGMLRLIEYNEGKPGLTQYVQIRTDNLMAYI
jgi:hypothetical protein